MKIIRRGILRSAYKKSDITDWISDAGVNVSKTHIGLSKHLRSGVEHLAAHKLSPAGTAFAAAAGIVNDNAVFFQRLQDGVRCTCPEASSVGQCNGVQNIGAYGVEAGDLIQQVYTISLEDGTERVWNHDELSYSYRHSIFKEASVRGKYAVCHVVFRLKKHFTPCLNYGGLKASLQQKQIPEEGLTAMMLRDIIIETRQHKLPDPKITGNAGSFFMNPIVKVEVLHRLQEQFANVPYYEVDAERVKVPAGWLIEQCGWKGKSLGPAAVHDKQALVLVNKGGAKGKDILALCRAVQEAVLRQFGIQLSPEVNFIGES